jgi:hypothetical protein
MSKVNRKSQGTLRGLFALALCCLAGAAAAAQTTVAPLPVKIGLWESSVTTTMSGLPIPPDVAEKMRAMGRPLPGDPNTMVMQACVTQDEWSKTLANLGKRGDMTCTTSNLMQDSQKLTFDESCVSPRGGTFAGHFEMFFDDAEHSHGEVHMKTAGAQDGASSLKITIDVSTTSHFVSADCGDMKPGDAKVIKTE